MTCNYCHTDGHQKSRCFYYQQDRLNARLGSIIHQLTGAEFRLERLYRADAKDLRAIRSAEDIVEDLRKQRAAADARIDALVESADRASA